MSTTRIFGNNPFEVYLKPVNKLEVTVSVAESGIKRGTVVAYKSDGSIVRADASNRALSVILGVVSDVSNGRYTVITQGFSSEMPEGMDSASVGEIWFLSESIPGTVKSSPPAALGTTRIAVAQKVDNGYLILGTPGVVNGGSYRGYMNVSGIQPVGTLSPFVGNTDLIPRNWLLCDGSYVSIDSYPDLFRLLGSIYGPVEDGRFKLPDFRGRTVVGAGKADGLSTRLIGEYGGEELHLLSVPEMPAHNHKPAITNQDGVDHWWGSDNRVGTPNFDYDGTSTTTTTKPSDGFIAPSYKTNTVGGNSPHNNMQPYSVAHWIIRAKAETEFSLVDVNVENLTNVEKGLTASSGDIIRYDGSLWRFIENSLSNLNDVIVPTDVIANDIITVQSVDADGIPTFKTSPPSGSNISIDITQRSHKNGSPRPPSVVYYLGTTSDIPIGRKGILHLNGTLEIEPSGSLDGTVNVNIIGYSGTNGLDILDTLTIPHYSQSNSKKVKVPFFASVAAQTYAGATGTNYKYAYYLSTETGAQFKANKLTINNVKFVY